MTRTAKNVPPEAAADKIAEIRRKIKDSSYVNNAVQRIAMVLSREIAGRPCRFKEITYG